MIIICAVMKYAQVVTSDLRNLRKTLKNRNRYRDSEIVVIFIGGLMQGS